LFRQDNCGNIKVSQM